MAMDLKKRKLELEQINGDLLVTSEDVSRLIDPFSKDQLMIILEHAALLHPDVLAHIRNLADQDPAKRKLFVRGLGWETTTECVRDVFLEYGEIEEAVVITDKSTGKSKGYGFVTFKHADAALRALKEPSKKIEDRVTVSQLASAGPAQQHQNAESLASRKIYVGKVPADLSPEKLLGLFSAYGEIEEGPLGFDKQTGRSRGFAIFIYKSSASVRSCLEEPLKEIDGHQLHCKLAEAPKQSRTTFSQDDELDLPLTDPSYGIILNPSSLTGKLSIDPTSINLTNLARHGLSLPHQLALSSSFSPSLKSSLSSSLAASLTPTASQGLAQALSASSYGYHSLGAAFGSQVAALVSPQSGFGSLGAGASLYPLSTSSQKSLLHGSGLHPSMSALQNPQVTQSSGKRSQSHFSYYD